MNRFALFVAAIVAVILFTPTPAEAYTVKVAVVADHACGDVMPQALAGRDLIMEAYWSSGGDLSHDLDLLEAVYTNLPDETVESIPELHTALDQKAKDIVAEMDGKGFVRFYAPFPGGEFYGWGGSQHSVTACGAWTTDAHEDVHVLDGESDPDAVHTQAYYNVEEKEMGVDGISTMCEGCRRVARLSQANVEAVSKGFKQLSSETTPGWLATPELPGFEFRVYITPVGGQTIDDTKAEPCIPETLCVSGALEGRPEVFIKIIGPRPNGYLWVQISRFTPSTVEVWVRQLSTGEEQEYFLRHVPAGFGHLDVSGLQDREAFLPQD